MDILSSVSSAGSSVAAAPEKDDRTTLGQDDFLRMLITQLESQDPLEPQDPTEFTAQLAQFTTLEQLIAIREGIDSLGAKGESTADLAALASLVGREVVVRGDSLEISASGGSPPIDLELQTAMNSVRVNLLDHSGNLVRTIQAGTLPAGRQTVAWDGLDRTGAALAPGVYTLEASGGDSENAARIGTLVRGPVRAVQPTTDGSAILEVGGIRVSADGVVEVRDAG